jgi:hypothetical protein
VPDPARDRAPAADAETRRRQRGEQAEAAEAQRLLFEEVRSAFRTPFVPLLVRRLSSIAPAYLERAWRELRPNVLTRAFEAQSDIIRTAAVREAAQAGTVSAGGFRETLRQRALSTSVVDEIVRAVNVACYTDPKLLLAATALDLALDNEPVGGAADLLPVEREAIAAGVPADVADLPALGDAEAPGRILRLWNDIVATLGLPAVTDDLRAVSRWPDFLEVLWATTRPATGRPGVSRLGAMAEEAARRLPFRITVGPAAAAQLGLSPAQTTDLARFVKDLRRRLPALVFMMALARYGLSDEGAEAAERSPFPV